MLENQRFFSFIFNSQSLTFSFNKGNVPRTQTNLGETSGAKNPVTGNAANLLWKEMKKDQKA